MNYQEEYEAICRAVASGGLKGSDLERLHQRGTALLKEDEARRKAELEAAKEAPAPVSEEDEG